VKIFRAQHTIRYRFRGNPAKKRRNTAVKDCLTTVCLASSLMLSACVSLPRPACSKEESLSVQEMLYFGTTGPAGIVSRSQWSDFLKFTVTPRFTQGFTVWPGDGQWQSVDGTIQHESTYILSLVHPDNDSSEQAVQEIISRYKLQFRQEAVLRVKFPACLSF
jgi:hypothetical protein